MLICLIEKSIEGMSYFYEYHFIEKKDSVGWSVVKFWKTK